MKLSPAIRRRIVKQAMQQICMVDGKLTPNAKLVLLKLRRFCGARGGELMFPKSTASGQIDPIAMARMGGRREVFDYLLHLLSMSLEERQNLIEDNDD